MAAAVIGSTANDIRGDGYRSQGPGKPSFGYSDKQHGGYGNQVKERVCDELHGICDYTVTCLGPVDYEYKPGLLAKYQQTDKPAISLFTE